MKNRGCDTAIVEAHRIGYLIMKKKKKKKKEEEKKERRKNEKTKCFIFRALYIRTRITQMTQKFERSRIQVERKQIGGWKVQFQRSIDKRIPSS